MATANFTAQRTIHESQSCKNRISQHETCNREGPTGILAFFATLPCGQRRAKFTMPRQEAERAGTPSMNDLLPLIFFR